SPLLPFSDTKERVVRLYEQLCRVRAGLALTLPFLALLLSSSQLSGIAIDWDKRQSRGDMDEVSRNDSRFQRVREELPRRGVVGYLWERPKNRPVDWEQEVKKGNLAQYAVAPVLVDFWRPHPLTIKQYRSGPRLSGSKGD